MSNIQFVNGPAKIHDIGFACTYYFNRDLLDNTTYLYRKTPKASSLHEELRAHFFPVSDSLLAFFASTESSASFYESFLVAPMYWELIKAEDPMALLMARLDQVEQIKKEMLIYYFPGTSMEKLVQYSEDSAFLASAIQNSTYPETIKRAMFYFFFAPDQAVAELKRELKRKAEQYEVFYGLKAEAVEAVSKAITEQELIENILHPDTVLRPEVVVSISVVDPAIANNNNSRTTSLILAGTQYKAALDFRKKHQKAPDLAAFGVALSEKNRVRLFQYIFNHKEVTMREIEREQEFSGTNAYYHLSLMIKAGMVSTKTRGRVLVYSIDKAYFEMISEYLRQYSLPDENEG